MIVFLRFFILVFCLFATSCITRQVVIPTGGSQYAPQNFGDPVQVAPDYYYRSSPTYPSYPVEPPQDYRPPKADPKSLNYYDDRYYVPPTYNRQYNNNDAGGYKSPF